MTKKHFLFLPIFLQFNDRIQTRNKMMVDSFQGNVILGNIIVLTASRGKQKLSIKMQIGPLLCFLVMEPSDACGRSEGVLNMRL